MSDRGNKLRQETSPYLLQHADNPVHWRPWGPAALAAARAADKPILLSVGYAACHWCHVMAHESFEDEATAALMNDLFVSIKVDREERPDIDHIYMSALHAMGEQGGWPLTMFLRPDGAPFWGGTYFPPEPRWGRPSFRQVLEGVAQAYRSGHEMVRKNAAALRAALQDAARTDTGRGLTPADLGRAADTLLRLVDHRNGGLRGAPKFPNPPIFRFLWQDAFRTGTEPGREALRLTLRRMAEGGIYDHLGGGFARYATDDIWLVPHFEKMLYDNGQLLELLALAQADAPDPLFAERAAETVQWMDRDMTAAAAPDGTAAFAASEDADSEGEEGRFYVWSEAEVDALLGADAAAFRDAYDVTEGGNWEGKTILRRMTPRGTAEQEAVLSKARAILAAARNSRVRPGRDDKVLADWNGLAITGLVRAGIVFGRPDWIARAARALDFVLSQLGAADGRVNHAWRLGRVTAAGLLDDQAGIARAALALHEATGDERRLAQAIRLADAAESFFADGAGGFFVTASDAADIPLGPEARPRVATDNATPAGNGLLAEVLARLHHLTGEPRWRDRAELLLRAFTGRMEATPNMPTLLAAADLLEEGASVVVTGDAASALFEDLCRVTLQTPDPAIVLVRAPDPARLPAAHPAHGKTAGPAGASAYVCRAGTCGRPVSDPAALAGMLRRRSVAPS